MVKSFLILFLGVSMLAIGSAAQDRLAVLTSVPLPELLEGKLTSANSLPGCGDDGNMTIYADEGDDDVRPVLFRLSPNGNLLAKIDIQHVSGFNADLNFASAPGLNGETYVLFQGRYPWYNETQHKLEVEGASNPTTELLRFSSAGELLSRIKLQPQFEASHVAAFSSGTILVIGRTIGQQFNRGPLVARLLTATGELLHEVLLPRELSMRYTDRRYEVPILVVMAVPGTDKVWLVRIGNTPVLSAVSEKGDLLLTTKLKTPERFRVVNPRVAGDRLFVALVPIEQKAKREPLYAQFDPVTGEVTQTLLAPGPRGLWNAICNSSNGMYFINTQERTLNVLVPSPPEVDSSKR
jgi:hypothetical protein